ncbi:MAG: zinc ribbon domain-containing protein [Nitrospiraceae bacterium]
MPIYEYRCGDCGKRSTLLILAKDTSEAPVCKHCRSSRLERIMSRFAAPKSEEARLESLADPSSLGGLDENDPKSMARWMKRMGREMGEDLGEDFDQAMEETEGGEEKSDTSDMD